MATYLSAAAAKGMCGAINECIHAPDSPMGQLALHAIELEELEHGSPRRVRVCGADLSIGAGSTGKVRTTAARAAQDQTIQHSNGLWHEPSIRVHVRYAGEGHMYVKRVARVRVWRRAGCVCVTPRTYSNTSCVSRTLSPAAVASSNVPD